MKIMIIKLSPTNPFNLDFTLCCGQAFRWDKHADSWYGVVRGRVLKVRQSVGKLEFEGVNCNFVEDYFALKADLSTVLRQIMKDRYIKKAVDQFRGLRILNQEPWECMISYICATYKNISAIKRMLFNLSRKFGEKIRFDGRSFYTFPTPKELTESTLSELQACELGYRAKYVHETAKMVHEENLDLEEFTKLSYFEAKKRLVDFPGVGSKVADCILLFSLRKLEAFPVDVWIRRAIMKYYGANFPKEFSVKILHEKSLSNSEYEKLNRFGREYFGKYAGYAQEYLYHYERAQ